MNLIKGIRIQYPTSELHLILSQEGNMTEVCRPYITSCTVLPLGKWWLYEKTEQTNPFLKRLKYRMRSRGRVLVNYLRTIQPDYAVTNTIVMPQLAMACKKLSINHTWFLHEIPMLTWDNYRFIDSDKVVFRKIGALSSKIIVPSDFANRFYKQHIPSGDIHTLAQAVDIEPSSEVRGNEELYTLLIVGRIEQNKGQMELLEAIKIVTDKGIQLLCRFVGGNDPVYLERCKSYVDNHNLGKYIEFAPFTPDISSHYHKADAVINCSAMEMFGRTPVEAQLCGLPVILSNVGANKERIIDGVNGYLYEKGDIGSLAAKIELLSDPARRNLFRDNLSLLDLNKHSISAFAENFLDIIAPDR